ncbi:glutamine amidotransferase [Marinimicrococcus flavescens]|uniref:Glutamine amidotransferase n=1 Tax=Marinimicrococcus flavescens TaxID=3031815 RepID=A0AAP3XQB3_9PROT|nr:glutamine amidotransferase [Marinimicrococcus flavescens]
MSSSRVLFVGESFTNIGLNLKGFSVYTTGGYEEGGKPLIDALGDAGFEVDYIRNHEVTSRFPAEPEALAAYDAVILSDVGADTFLLHPDTLFKSRIRPNPLASIASYVAGGGGFLMVGGYMSFSGIAGSACYPNTVIADILPVTMMTGDDRIERPEGVRPEPVAEHPALEPVDGRWPTFLGYQRLVARREGEVLLKAGGDPFLVVGRHGKGRTAAFASDCSPHWGTPEFVGWQGYGPFWGRLVGWLAGRS